MSPSPVSAPGPKVLADGSVSIPIVRSEQAESSTHTAMEVEHTQSTSAAGSHLQPLVTSSTEEPATVPRPRHVSDLELKVTLEISLFQCETIFQVLSGCLTRWRSEVCEQMASLERDIRDMEAQIAAMYEEQQMRQRGYRLHAVMVHEGDVNQGHYWAYVFHPGRKVWLKFNDNTVSETSWAGLS